MAGGDTYDSQAEAEADRDQQRSLLVALNAWDRALRRDDCSAWCIAGKHHGRIYGWGDGKAWVLYVRCRSEKHWLYTKRRLAFCEVTQEDGENGGLELQPKDEETAQDGRELVGDTL